MSRFAIFMLSFAIVLVSEARTNAATYKVTVKGKAGENDFVKDATFDVVSGTGFSVFKSSSGFDPESKSYTLDIDEPKLDFGQTVSVDLIVSAPRRARVTLKLLLGKFNHNIGVVLPACYGYGLDRDGNCIPPPKGPQPRPVGPAPAPCPDRIEIYYRPVYYVPAGSSDCSVRYSSPSVIYYDYPAHYYSIDFYYTWSSYSVPRGR